MKKTDKRETPKPVQLTPAQVAAVAGGTGSIRAF